MHRHLWLVLSTLLVGACQPLEERIFDWGLAQERANSRLVLRGTEAGADLAYLERPGGGDTVVLLHGFGADKDHWLLFTRQLPASYRVLAPDLPGHGDNPMRWEVTYTVEYYVQRFAEFVDGVGLQQFHLVGNSLGGYIAAQYALNFPHRIKSLGLFNAAGVEAPRQSEFFRRLEAGDNLLMIESREDFHRMMELIFHEPPKLPWPAVRVTTRRQIARSPFKRKLWDDVWSRRRAITERLAEIRAPTLVLWGGSDRLLDVSSAQVFGAHLPDATIAVLPQSGHVPMLEHPEQTVTVYMRFLNGE